MEFDFCLAQLSHNAAAVQQLVEGVSAEQARWKPDEASWSILEVLCHLYDEEREDFRVKLDLILHRPDTPWPPIDPAGWVTTRAYNERDLGITLLGDPDDQGMRRPMPSSWLMFFFLLAT